MIIGKAFNDDDWFGVIFERDSLIKTFLFLSFDRLLRVCCF